MQEHLQTIMDTIVMPVLASVGGMTGIITIIMAIAKIIATAKSGNKAVSVAMATETKVTSLLGNLSTAFQEELEKRLNCQFKVDFSAKLNEELKDLEIRLLSLATVQKTQLNALKVLMTDIATMYTTSRNITEEERLNLLEHISTVNALIVEPKAPEKEPDVVVIEYREEQKEANTVAIATETKQKQLRGI